MMEDEMGGSFGDVQVHTGAAAVTACESINARAFTVGNHVAFNQGEYNPSSPDGQHVIAHELAHVRQQTGGAVSMLPQAGLALEIDPDPQLEREAESTARRVMEGKKLGIQRLGNTELHVQRSGILESGLDGIEEQHRNSIRARGRGEQPLSERLDTIEDRHRGNLEDDFDAKEHTFHPAIRQVIYFLEEKLEDIKRQKGNTVRTLRDENRYCENYYQNITRIRDELRQESEELGERITETADEPLRQQLRTRLNEVELNLTDYQNRLTAPIPEEVSQKNTPQIRDAEEQLASDNTQIQTLWKEMTRLQFCTKRDLQAEFGKEKQQGLFKNRQQRDARDWMSGLSRVRHEQQAQITSLNQGYETLLQRRNAPQDERDLIRGNITQWHQKQTANNIQENSRIRQLRKAHPSKILEKIGQLQREIAEQTALVKTLVARNNTETQAQNQQASSPLSPWLSLPPVRTR
jgi:hypothetical protein